MSSSGNAHDFDPLLAPGKVHPTSHRLLKECPVAHSAQSGGFWVINRYADLLRVMQDPTGFLNGGPGVRIPDVPVEQPPMLPIDSNAPMHRQLRRALNPYFSPQAVATKEIEVRRIIAAILDPLAPRGSADMAAEFSKVFPAEITLRLVFGISDRSEIDRVRTWVRRLSYDLFKASPEELAEAQRSFREWALGIVQARRGQTGGGDVVGALLDVQVEEGRSLTDLELAGAIQNLTLAGFSTTSDATCSVIIQLIDDPELESLLRSHPELIPDAIEEVMRLEPPVTSRPRLCTKDVTVDGAEIRAGDRLLCNYVAANRDPEQFDDPEAFDLAHIRQRPLTFGAGPHRCIGSHLARLTLRVMLEELLKRVTRLRFAPGEEETRVSFNAAAWRSVDRLPVEWTPLAR